MLGAQKLPLLPFDTVGLLDIHHNEYPPPTPLP